MSDYGNNSFGIGSYGNGNDFIVPLPNPPGIGYGGVGYGTGSYGGIGFALPNYPISGGYGGDAYGHGPYGSLADLTPPSLVSAISLNGFQIELFFSEPMQGNSDLIDPTNYTLAPLVGAATSTVTLVEVGIESTYGPTSVILTHTGTTLGGFYEISVVNIQDLGGANIEWNGQNKTELLTKGEPPDFTATPISGTEIVLDFEQDMLTEGDFSPGIESLTSYGIETEYPIDILIQQATHPYLADLSQVLLDVMGMTSADYEINVSPASAIIYEGSGLPSESSDFVANEVGSGTSAIDNGLKLSAIINNAYGWSFEDSSGKILPNSTYRVDYSIDLTSIVITNVLTKAIVFSAIISDGSVQTRIDFHLTNSGEEVTVSSGTFTKTISQKFLDESFVVSWIRNQKADIYTLAINDTPLFSEVTASLNGVSGISPGTRFLINTEGNYDISEFILKDLNFTSSQTVFSAAWNFLHNQLAPFIGLAGQVKDFILTEKGPLVKAWGNATPATKQDVAVYINDIEIEVEDVNPYFGKIHPTIPIPLLPPGSFTVTIDYKWMYNPVFPFAGLNTEGLVLNKFDPKPLIPQGITQIVPTSQLGEPIQGNFHRFAYGLALNSVKPRQPLQRSSRFIAFQKQYTAALNSASTLILNANPHIIKKPSEEEFTEGTTVFYEGTEDPTLSDPNWNLIGEAGSLEAGQGNGDFGFELTQGEIFSVIDTSTGSFGEGQPSFYVRSEQVPFSSSVVYVVRFVVTDDVERTSNGVFTGVGFGYHDNNHLYLVGALIINGLQHIGMLVEPAYPEQEASWKLGYEEDITILNSDTFSTTNLPKLVRERIISEDLVRFQIRGGSQTGIYEITEFIAQSDGSFTVSVTPDFPADPSLFGNRDAIASYEIRWDGDGDRNRPLTYRLVTKTDSVEAPNGFAELFVGGSLSGKALELSGVPAFAIPPDGVLLYPTGSGSEFFWGSLSRLGTNSSDWNFVRYGVQPGREVVHFDGISVDTSMLVLPEENPNYIWFVTQEFGSRQIDVKNQLLLKSTSSSNQEGVEGLDLTIGYSRIEPFFNRKISCDFVSYFQVDSGILGAGDAQIIIDDGEREVFLATILYEETLSERKLLYLQEVSLSGLLLPQDQGWEITGDASTFIQGQRLQIYQEIGQAVAWTKEDFSESPVTNNRIFDVRFRSIEMSSPNETGVFFGLGVGPLGNQRGIGFRLLLDDRVELFSLSNQAPVLVFPFEWNDQDIHNLRAVVDYDSDVMTVVIDDIVVGTAFVTSFDFYQDTAVTFGLNGFNTSATFEVEDLSATVLPPSTAKRTLGIFKGSDKDDINSWYLPRLDSLEVKNSDLSAQIQEVDWTSLTKVRLHRDPTWGVILQLPQLGNPPSFTGNFATQTLIPSSGWISVEYSKLPLSNNRRSFGRFSFGSFDPLSISQQRWGFVKYRIFLYPGKDQLAPQNNVLNYNNVITSGEWINDKEVETVTVLSKNSTTISLLPTNILAARVFSFSYVDKAGEVVWFYPESFTFDVDTQVITITSEINLAYQPSQDLPDLESPGVENPSLNDPNWPYEDLAQTFDPDGVNPFLPSPPLLQDPVQVPVTINFAAGNLYTKEYICSQPLEVGSTIVNDDTPDYTRNFICDSEAELLWNSQLNDPWDLLQGNPPITLNDYPYLGFLDETGPCACQYENIEFCEVTSGEPNLLSPFCDDSIPVGYPGIDGSQEGDLGNGLISIAFSGLSFTETEKIGFVDGPQGGFVNTILYAGQGELEDAFIIPDLGDDIPPIEDAWQVVGYLYNTVTKQTEKIYFIQG